MMEGGKGSGGGGRDGWGVMKGGGKCRSDWRE